MPWVQVHMAKKLDKGGFEAIKKELAVILMEEFEKPEQGLTVTFYRPDAYYRAGEATDTAANIEIKYIGSFPLARKQAVTKRLAAFFSARFGIDPMKLTAVFSENDGANWGRKAGDFS